MELTFVPRTELEDREWNDEAKLWDRPKIDREALQELNRRSTSEGMLRLIVHAALILATAWLTVLGWRHRTGRGRAISYSWYANDRGCPVSEKTVALHPVVPTSMPSRLIPL
jgi:hypothetical protein